MELLDNDEIKIKLKKKKYLNNKLLSKLSYFINLLSLKIFSSIIKRKTRCNLKIEKNTY